MTFFFFTRCMYRAIEIFIVIKILVDCNHEPAINFVEVKIIVFFSLWLHLEKYQKNMILHLQNRHSNCFIFTILLKKQS